MATQNITKLKDLTGKTVYPITHVKAIVGLSEKLDKTNLMTEITYAELVELRDNSELIPGMMYRITDYTCTTTQDDTQSAGHVFDIIVTAVEVNKVSELARAIQHEGDTYFSENNLEAWQLWYDLDNDTTKYLWADPVNGKGVVYRMIDEFQNDCPYDFKNIQFKRYWCNGYAVSDSMPDFIVHKGYCSITGNEDDADNTNFQWCYTFSRLVDILDGYSNISELTTIVDESVQTDGFDCDSEDKIGLIQDGFNGIYNFHNKCSLNSISSLTVGTTFDDVSYMVNMLPNNVFFSLLFDTAESLVYQPTYNNKLGSNCYSNTFGSNCYSNTFGNYCASNTFGSNCYSNTFGNYCASNTFGSNCYSNTFGSNCASNTFGNYCDSNTFGNYCDSNTFGNYCDSNTFGNYCASNTFGNYCDSNTFGNGVFENDLKFNWVIGVKLDDTVAYINLKPADGEQGTAVKYLSNIHILRGVHGGTRARSQNYKDGYNYSGDSNSKRLDVVIDTYAQDYEICVGFTPDKTLKYWASTPID